MNEITVSIHTEYIKLDQLLKFSGIAETGSAAKEIILSGNVLVNGEVCTMRGKKLYGKDKVTVLADGKNIDIILEKS